MTIMPVKPHRMSARHYTKDQLVTAMQDARAHILSQVEDLSDQQWRIPYKPDLNPIAWELAHIAWFAEWWTLRGPHQRDTNGRLQAQHPARYIGPDTLFDSSIIPHKKRWDVPIPDRQHLFDRLAMQMEATLTRLRDSGESDAELYLFRLALFHEDMHAEAFTYLRAALSFPPPPDTPIPSVPLEAAQAILAASSTYIGQPETDTGFYFDNEKWAHMVTSPALYIDTTPLSSAAFLQFVEAGGYDNPEFWPHAAGHWRQTAARSHPVHWRKAIKGWQYRWFNQWLPLAGEMPIMHINAYEAQAYCRWARRDLLTEAQWEAAAQQHIINWGGLVWEWMANPFTPYPGFSPDAYQDYSAPWFDSHTALRGGSFATHPRILHPQYRNFYLPERNNIFAGVRTCALSL